MTLLDKCSVSNLVNSPFRTENSELFGGFRLKNYKSKRL